MARRLQLANGPPSPFSIFFHANPILLEFRIQLRILSSALFIVRSSIVFPPGSFVLIGCLLLLCPGLVLVVPSFILSLGVLFFFSLLLTLPILYL